MRALSYVRAPALVSPDGRYIAIIDAGRAVTIMKVDGTVTGSTAIGIGRAVWLPDSSGLFVETSAPQRAGPLAVIEIDGRTTATELEMAAPMLSRDGRSIVAEQQEGCCVDIITRELRVSPRAGGPAKTLARSATSGDTQPISLLAVDSANRALYRDGQTLKLVPIDGGIPVDLPAPGVDVGSLVVMGESQSGSVVLMSTASMNSRVFLLSNKVAIWGPDDGDPIVVPVPGRLPAFGAPIWRGEAEVLVRSGEGRIGYRNLASGTFAPLAAALPANANVLAYGDGAILWSDGKRIHIVALDTGTDRQAPASVPALDVVGAATDNGGFLVLTTAAGYLLD